MVYNVLGYLVLHFVFLARPQTLAATAAGGRY